MDDYRGIVGGLLARLYGPTAFRFLLQPLTASALAIRDGRRDPLLSGWREVGSVMIVAALVDRVFQFMVFGGFDSRRLHHPTL